MRAKPLINALFAATVIAAMPMPAAAQVRAITGGDWPDICTSKTTNQMDRMYCQAYARGIADGLTLWQVGQPETAEVCFPKTVAEQELIAVGSNYIRRNPKDRNLRISVVLGLAFLEAWPCKR
jgi:hypothetical protein